MGILWVPLCICIQFPYFECDLLGYLPYVLIFSSQIKINPRIWPHLLLWTSFYELTFVFKHPTYHDYDLRMSIAQNSVCLHDHNLDSFWHALILFLSRSNLTFYDTTRFVHTHSSLVGERYMLLLHFMLLLRLCILDYVVCPVFWLYSRISVKTYMSAYEAA